jgi:hypothetical protein
MATATLNVRISLINLTNQAVMSITEEVMTK